MSGYEITHSCRRDTIDFSSIAFGVGSSSEAEESGRRWFPYVKGSDFRKWFGNQFCVVDWWNDGAEIRALRGARPQNVDKYFRRGVTYNNISKNFCARKIEAGFIFDQKNSMLFSDSEADDLLALGILHSSAIGPFLDMVSPKDFNPGALKILPVPRALVGDKTIGNLVAELVEMHRDDWDSCEVSWDFRTVVPKNSGGRLDDHCAVLRQQCIETVRRAHELEEDTDRRFIQAYGLEGEISSAIPIEHITLSGNPAYRYGGDLTEEEQWTRFRQDTMKELASYAVGCMMGRYSLDTPGLIYAHSGNEGFDHDKHKKFPADDDGVVPVFDVEWSFDDDAATRLIEFISVTWDKARLEENLTFLASNLGPKKGESSRDTIRRYISSSFFGDHLQTYKNRPIYWLFSSGKQKAFEALVYLHRYNEGTLARMRTEYVIPLQGKIKARIAHLEQEEKAASSTAQARRFAKERAGMDKKQVELAAFDEKLKHYADQRIALDLDDGVKVNYGKFGDLLAEVKKVTGKKPE
ncbi:BREX-1 system adenine-specific DNA-methyltransferase PglX [Myxococcota bacterium]